ncbi:unnamed protein product [Penicillium olsonii]|uniref:DUF614 domain protein n=1 Tax=Penicillium olsonii TaxID=99116 RepID=A0A9W4HZY2_PENOL|nr:unnamed protein product [Penicillium olsonii]CAG8280450.1 unnamed protein product [Penicillium olsonii]
MSRLNLDTSVGGNQNRYSFMETPLEMNSSSQLPGRPSPSDSRTPQPTQHQNFSSPTQNEKTQYLQHQGILPDYANCPPAEQHPANYAPLANIPAQHENNASPSNAIAPRAQQEPSIVTQYATAPANQDYSAQIALQSYTNHSYHSLPHHAVSPQQYATQSYTNIPGQQQETMSQQAYADISAQHRGTPLSAQPYAYSRPQSYTTLPEQEPRGTQLSPQPYTYTAPPVSPPSSPGPLPLKVRPDVPRSNTMDIVPDANPLQSPKLTYFPPPTRAATAPEDLSAFHNPGQTTHPNQEATGGGWSNGLCELSNLGICCLGLFCPCVLYGRTQHRLSMKSRKEDPTNMLGYETCNGSCTGMGLLCGCQWLMATIQHTRVRKAYKIQGSVASDCVRASCCTCCTLIQDEKEVQKREDLRARAARERGTTLFSPYTTPGPMSYGPTE